MSGPRSLDYSVELAWDGQTGGEAKLADYPNLKMDMAKEYGGLGRFPCPDQLFASAVAGCLMTTCLWYARRINAKIEKLEVSVSTNVKLTGPQGYRVTKVSALIHAFSSKDQETKVRRCAEGARDFCHITKSIEKSIPTEVAVEVTSGWSSQENAKNL
jgi:organic hydroperoxide reductase OsmC/OhrA